MNGYQASEAGWWVFLSIMALVVMIGILGKFHDVQASKQVELVESVQATYNKEFEDFKYDMQFILDDFIYEMER